MKKKILSLFIATTMFASLFTGCGSDTSVDSGTSGNVSSNEDNDKTISEDNDKPIKLGKVKEEYSLSEYLSLGETIWYSVNGTGKDSEVKAIYVMEADGTMYYASYSSLRLGEVEQKEDSQIAKEVKEKYAENMKEKILVAKEDASKGAEDKIGTIVSGRVYKELGFNTYRFYYGSDAGYIDMTKDSQIKNIIEECIQECLQEGATSSYSSEDELGEMVDKMIEKYATKYAEQCTDYLTPLYETYVKNVPPASYKLSIVTDSTGNNTEKEKLVFQEGVPLVMGGDEEDEESEYGFYCGGNSKELKYIYPYESSQGATNCFNIYDSWYGGYMVDNLYFVTRLNATTTFALDNVGTKDIMVDVSDSSLFDRSILIPFWKVPWVL